LEIKDNLSVSKLLDIVGEDLEEDMETYKKLFQKNMVKTVKHLKNASLESWKEWDLPSGVKDSLKQKIGILSSSPLLFYLILWYNSIGLESDFQYMKLPPWKSSRASHVHLQPCESRKDWTLVQHPDFEHLFKVIESQTFIAISGRTTSGEVRIDQEFMRGLSKINFESPHTLFICLW
jgi:hypothetical protein